METLTLVYILIGVGVILLLGELLIPTGGFLFIPGVAAIILGVAVSFVLGDLSTGFITLISVFVALPFLGTFFFWLWPRMPLGSKILRPPEEVESVGAMQANTDLEKYRGQVGRAVSTLRPSGVVEFDGHRVDSITEGMMIDEGSWVRCVGIQSSRVIVRAVDRPNLAHLENTSFTD